MSRWMRCVAMSLALLFAAGSFSCYGKFQLTRKIYTWNGTLGNKWVNSIVMWVLIIVPVYGIGSFVDLLILNTIEFWTGNNPMSMGPGEKETQLVAANGNEYEVTATQNRMEIVQLTGTDAGKTTVLTYHPSEKAWYMLVDGEEKKVAQLRPSEDRLVEYINPYDAR